MANTFQLISSYTATGSVASIDFTSIPSTFTDLCVKTSLRGTAAFDRRILRLRLNNSSNTADYTDMYLLGNGASASSATSTGAGYIQVWDVDAASATANTFSNIEIYIPNYAGATSKSVSTDGVQENNQTTAYVGLVAGLYSPTTAITQVNLFPDSGNFAIYSSAYLYGIKNS